MAKAKAIKKIKIDIPDLKQVEINGHVFDILKSDMDILQKASDMVEEYSNIKPTDIKAISAAIHSMIDYVNSLLGEGSISKISGGKPVYLETMINIMQAVTEAAVGTAVETYEDRIADEYE